MLCFPASGHKAQQSMAQRSSSTVLLSHMLCSVAYAVQRGTAQHAPHLGVIRWHVEQVVPGGEHQLRKRQDLFFRRVLRPRGHLFRQR